MPELGRLLQAGKQSSGMTGSTAEAKQEIAAAVVEEMRPQTLYLLGSGTTVRAIADELGIEKTLLGVDAVVDSHLVGRDLNERSILELLDRYPQAVIIVTPLGGNGFILGRDNIVVVANRDKLLRFSSLHIDTGDPELDDSLAGYIDVIVARNCRKVMRVR